MTATTVNVADLRQALRVTLPFTDRTGIPALQAVHLEADHNNLVATATDRYVLGHIRILAGGNALPSTVVPRRAARIMRRALDDIPGNMPAQLRRVRKLHGPDFLEVAAADVLTIRVRVLDVRYPDVIKLFAQDGEQRSGLDVPVDLDPTRVRPFAKASKTLGVCDVRWTFYGDTKPVRVDIGRTFAGILMPRRFPHSFDPAPVPVGLVQRAQAAAVPA